MAQNTDQTYLLQNQYKNAANLNARIQLHARFGTTTVDWHQWIFDHFNLARDMQILELGCGPGTLWRKNMYRIPSGCRIILSDFSPGMVSQAEEHLKDNPHFTFEVIDAQTIPYEAQHFDMVIANHMLYHVPDINRAFAEMRRVLKPQGRFYASTIGQTHLQELNDLVKRIVPEAEIFSGLHTQPFTLENGAAQMTPWFSGVILHNYEDELVITEADPLIAYVLSTTASTLLVDDKLEAFSKLVAQELADHGAIHVTKASGLFQASKDDILESDR